MAKAKLHVLKPHRTVSANFMESMKHTQSGIKSGEVTSVAVVGKNRDGSIFSYFDIQDSPGMVGATEYLKERILRDWINS